MEGRANKRAVQGAPQKQFIILFTDYTKPTETQHTMRGVCSFSCCSCLTCARRAYPLLDVTRRGGYPPCHVLMWQGGYGPSLSCLGSKFDATRRGRSHFNMMRRGMPPPCYTVHGGEWYALPAMSSFQFRHGEEG